MDDEIEKKILGKGLWGGTLYYVASLPSTNTHLREHHASYKEGDVLWALEQTQGRGTRGRSWHSDGGKSLTFSLLVKDLLPSFVPNAAQMVALSVLEFLKEGLGVCSTVKWPNDVLVQKKKVCGILAEQVENHLVVGIGLNLYESPLLEDKVDQPFTAVSLYATKPVPSLEETLVGLLPFLEKNWDLFKEEGFKPFYESFKKACPMENKAFLWVEEERQEPIRVLGIEEDGTLSVLNSTGEIKRVVSGSLKPLPDA